MIELIISWFDGMMHIIATAPLQLWAIVLGTLISWGFTQKTKFLIPESYTREKRHRLAQCIAFLSGFTTTWALWQDRYGFIVAMLVGMFSPFTYRIVMSWMANKFPDTRKILSMDYPDGTETAVVKKKPKKVVAVQKTVGDDIEVKVELKPMTPEENT